MPPHRAHLCPVHLRRDVASFTTGTWNTFISSPFLPSSFLLSFLPLFLVWDWNVETFFPLPSFLLLSPLLLIWDWNIEYHSLPLLSFTSPSPSPSLPLVLRLPSSSPPQLKQSEERMRALEKAVECASDPARLRMLPGDDPSCSELADKLERIEVRERECVTS